MKSREIDTTKFTPAYSRFVTAELLKIYFFNKQHDTLFGA